MSAAVDSVVLIDQDDDSVPPTHVLRVHGHPSTEKWPVDMLTFEACAYDETNDSATFSVLATFGIDLTDLLAALALVIGDNRLLIPPGLCWNDPGVTWPDGFKPRCELLAGHAGAHESGRGELSGSAVWTDGERDAEEPMAGWEVEVLASSLNEAEQESIAEQVYEAYRLGRMAAKAEHLPMWHEPESRERLPQVEIRRCLDAVEAVLMARTTAVSRA